MPLGAIETTGVAFWTGDPSSALVGNFDVPKGTLVIDNVNGALYQKTGVLGVNAASYKQLIGSPVGTKIYRALLTQTTTNAPVATVLENTLGGTVVWTRSTNGIYVATLAAAFTTGKTLVNLTLGAQALDAGAASAYSDNADTVTLLTYIVETSAPGDSLITKASLEIIVYQ